MLRIITYLFILATAVAGIVFASLNPKPVEVNYIFASIELPLSVLIVIALGVGLVIGLLFSAGVYLKLQRHIFQLKGQVKMAQQEIDNLRALPIKDTH